MNFFKFCEYLEKLEKTASRNEMTVILAQMYKQMAPEEAKLATYLVQGQLGPSFANPNFGMAEKQILKAIGGDIEKTFKKVGDLGTAIQEYKSIRVEEFKKVKIEQVFEKLLEIANVEGTGSQEIKQHKIRELVEEIDGRSAKYVIRIVLSKLRMGFSDKTILDALSWTLSGDKKYRGEIENMYNVGADLGMVVEEIIKNNKPHKMTPKMMTPVIMARCERATKAEEIWERNGECAVEYKLDGLRIQAHIQKSNNPKIQSKVKLFSRGLEDMTAMFPDVVEGLRKQINHDCIVEGEMIAVSADGKTLAFNKTMNRKRKYDVDKMVEEIPMAIFLFDVLMVDGKNVIEKSNVERWGILENMITSPLTPLLNANQGVRASRAGEGAVRLMPRIIVKNADDIQKMFDKALKEGMEGIVAKRLDSPYTPGSRDFAWIKMKPVLDSVDVVVMGYSAGEGKRTDFGIGEFLVGVYDPKKDKYLTVSKVGSGATDEEWVRLRKELENIRVEEKPNSYEVTKQYEQDFWVKPSLVLEVTASEISESPAHSSGYGLRFPRLISWREKKPEDATSVQEIAKLFSMQKGGDLDAK